MRTRIDTSWCALPELAPTPVSRETWPAWLREAEPALTAYAGILASAGVERGLIGPREVPRLWERHLLNCAVVADPAGPIGDGASVLDIGAGAGLPGLVWAIVRPDLNVTLAEPLLRRSTFLVEAAADLGLTERVTVLRARAEDLSITADIVTARAVAPLERLAAWALPRVRQGGELVALKGQSAAEELATAQRVLTRLGAHGSVIEQWGAGVVDPPTTVVRVRA